jgi:hypothetical protein
VNCRAPSRRRSAGRAATEAAPWLVGSDKPKEAVDPEELFERLKPFKDLVADDIRDGEENERES